MPRRRVFTQPDHDARPVCNQSKRAAGAMVRAVAIHTTESHDRPGTSDVESIVNWFDNPQSQASSHLIIDAEGNTAKCVPFSMKAWTIGEFNSLTVNIELIGWAATPRWRWLKRDRQIRECAKWVAFVCRRFDLPVQRGALAKGKGGVPVVRAEGVVCHMDATACGFGTHTDPGKGFPMDRLLRYSRWYRAHGWFRG